MIQTFPMLLWIGIGMLPNPLFSFVTLPVEKNATNRAIQWLSGAGITDMSNHNEGGPPMGGIHLRGGGIELVSNVAILRRSP